jgi:integrase/recombinase XerD
MPTAIVPAAATAIAGAGDLPDISILAGQLAPSSERMYRRDVAAYLTWCAANGCAGGAPASLARYRAHLAGGTRKSPATINRELAAVKRLAREAAAQGLLDSVTAAQFAALRGVKKLALKDRVKQHHLIGPEQMRALVQAPDPATPLGLRDRALLLTLATSGIRVSEAVSLRVDAIHTGRDGGYLLSVCGKTDVSARSAPLAPAAYQAIQAWLAARAGVDSPYVFTSTQGKGQQLTSTPLTATGAWRLVGKYANQIGLAHIAPHDFRRFVVTQVAARSGIREAQKVAGHRSINTTALYDLAPMKTGTTDDLF